MFNTRTTEPGKITGFKLLKLTLHFRIFFMIFVAISKEFNLSIYLPSPHPFRSYIYTTPIYTATSHFEMFFSFDRMSANTAQNSNKRKWCQIGYCRNNKTNNTCDK